MSVQVIDNCPVVGTPFAHQLSTWRRCRDYRSWGHLWEQGTGKTKEIIMQAAWLYRRGEIDGMLVLAPNGVHRNWVTDQFPAHWPNDEISGCGAPGMVWYRPDRAGTKKYMETMEALVRSPGFAVLAMSYDAILTEDRKTKPGHPKTPGGKSWAKDFLTRRRCMIVADESSRIKSPVAKRTKVALKASGYAQYRRILNGTPVPNSPFDIYSQVKFLCPEFWAQKGISSFQGFRQQFGVWGKGYTFVGGNRREFPHLLSYRNLETLQRWLGEITDRVTKDDVLDIPPKLYKRMEFDLSPAQRKVYDALRDEAVAFLASGDVVTAPVVLTRLLRLQQVTCGYVPTDDGGDGNIHLIGDNPRLDLLREVIEDLPHPAIVWVRFRRDADLIMEMLAKMGKTAVRYDGAVDADGRMEAVDRFQNERTAQFFVSNPAAGGEGLTLHAARTVIYYANGFNLQHRLQSEDRAHRIGQEHPVQYIDLVASDTIDEHVVKNLQEKMNVAGMVTGDKVREWLLSVR